MQVGDKVRLTNVMPKGWDEGMKPCLNQVVTINEIYNLGFFKTKEYHWNFHQNNIMEILTEDPFESQVKTVLNHLQESTITSWEAINKYGITRLSAIIFVLRKDYTITSTRKTQGKKWWTEYKLIK
jgi:hypothetical protein